MNEIIYILYTIYEMQMSFALLTVPIFVFKIA